MNLRYFLIFFFFFSQTFSFISCAAFLNPVINDYDTPDPGVDFDPINNMWWAATTTGNNADTFALHSSTDLGTWHNEGFMFPYSKRPSWMVSDCWAPELHYISNRWVAVYVGRTSTGLLSIGVGWSSTDSPIGPWIDSGAPIITDIASGIDAEGQIDPTIFIDESDGTPYLIFKEDGNFNGKATPFHYARLITNGTALAYGEENKWKKTSILDHDLDWEGELIEAPWLVKSDNIQDSTPYYLFYSGNGYGANYAVGVARSSSLLGPYTKFGPPILAQTSTVTPVFEAPGHCSVLRVDRSRTNSSTGGINPMVIVYHVFKGDDRNARYMAIDALQWNTTSGWPFVAGGVPSYGGFLPHNYA
jgi:beta-xylosidase